ncbi:MAG TPA: phosphoglycerate dehydrogenase [Kofleriaceae bacterium]|jgi:D-3-phosphoglycerate dehydrogenase|nr:phosphoglycerate dehydrogenase [Kofleriaceae bacterium]
MSEPVTSFPKDQIKVLLLENIHVSAHEIFHGEGFHVETVAGALKEAELIEKIRDVHVLGIRSKTRVTPAALAEARRLLAVGCFCIGTNQVALRDANTRGVPVFNAPFSNTRSVAEMIIAEIVFLARQLGDRLIEVHQGKWRKVSADCHEVRGKTLGIVGYGHIGTQVGVLAEAFGMRVLYYDIASKLPVGNVRAVPTLGDLMAQSDFVTLHVPETPQTKEMIGAAEIARMKPGSYLLNASRGTVVVIDALAAALREGRIAGAAVDVYPEEPEGKTDDFASALRGLTNVILTPHIGGSTEEAQEAIGREVGTSLVKLVNAGSTTGAVNFPQVELASSPGAHRILNVHRNVPGVLRDINKLVSDLGANIRSQHLATDPDIGYLVMDLDQDVSNEVKRGIAALETSIKTRILY